VRTVINTLDFLAGQWRAEREITDFRSGTRGVFTGTASFTRLDDPADPGALTYQEHGQLTFGGHRGPASRCLLYVPAVDGAVAVRFADGRDFYRLDLRSGCCEAEHPCRGDQYAAIVRVLGPHVFTEQWRVTGPGKDYVMTTTLSRIGPAA
jgi:hypothetical protein